MGKHYTASLNKSQGRIGYTVIFRHPVRKDDTTGKPGLRIRMGLGTRDEDEAIKLRDQLNELLSNPQYHNPSARANAERKYSDKVVEIFYTKMVPERIDYTALREEVIPLPVSEPEGYRKVLFLGTTGAGKTTLVRQIIGTDPEKERFPSTSTAKTTIHDTEIVLKDGSWQAVVTFVSSDEVRENLSECISAAVLLASNKEKKDSEILTRLLNHVNQRFRFNYILGNGPQIEESDFDVEDEELLDVQSENFGNININETNELLGKITAQLPLISERLRKKLHSELDTRNEEDERVVEELFEEGLDNFLRNDEEFHEIVDVLMDEIEKRFDLLPAGNLKKTKQGWPLTWSGEWENDQRDIFLKEISRFSSNYAPYFGSLLTPLVNGIRVSGPFSSSWDSEHIPKLVLMDGEGLGHTPKSSSSVSTTVSQNIEKVDAVILVDNAMQPMQAAPLAAIRELVATGNARKLIFAFTHFDEVKGDNLPNATAKAQHVLASAESAISSIGEDLGPNAERSLRTRLDTAKYFLSDLQTSLGMQTIKQLRNLLQSIDEVIERPKPTESRPVYDRMNLGFSIQSAVKAYHESWRPKLGLDYKPGYSKEHWTRVKALTRKLAVQDKDEYDSLKPVADLRKLLLEKIYIFIHNPLKWEGPVASEQEKQDKYDALADNISKKLLELSTRRVKTEQIKKWEEAYYKCGSGSTFVRAKIIGDDIYQHAVPKPDITPTPDRNQFLNEVVKEVESAMHDEGAILR